jgi:hypothetical protein
MTSLPPGIPSNLPLEEFSTSNFPHDLERAKEVHGDTHYGFKSVIHNDGRHHLKGRPFANWKERQEARHA